MLINLKPIAQKTKGSGSNVSGRRDELSSLDAALAAIAAASCRVACCELASRRLAVLHLSSSAGLLAVAHPFAALPAGEITRSWLVATPLPFLQIS